MSQKQSWVTGLQAIISDRFWCQISLRSNLDIPILSTNVSIMKNYEELNRDIFNHAY